MFCYRLKLFLILFKGNFISQHGDNKEVPFLQNFTPTV